MQQPSMLIEIKMLHGKNEKNVLTRDVKKIRTRRYPWIKPATGKKQILKMDIRYLRVRVFLIPAC